MGCITAAPTTIDEKPPPSDNSKALPNNKPGFEGVNSSSTAKYEPPDTNTVMKDRTAPATDNNAATNNQPKDDDPTPLFFSMDTGSKTESNKESNKPKSHSAAVNFLQMLNTTAPQPQKQIPVAQHLYIHHQQQALEAMRAKSAPAPPTQPQLNTSHSDGHQRTYNPPQQYTQAPHRPQLMNSNSFDRGPPPSHGPQLLTSNSAERQPYTQGPNRPQLVNSNSHELPQRPLTPTRYAQQQQSMQVPYTQANRPHSARNLNQNQNHMARPVMQRHMFRSVQDMNASAQQQQQAPTNPQHALMQMRTMGSSPNLTGVNSPNTNTNAQHLNNPQHALMRMRQMGSSPNLTRSNAPNTQQNGMIDRQQALMRMRQMGSSPNLARSNANNMQQQTNNAPPMMNRAMFYSAHNLNQPQQNNVYQQQQQQQQAQYAQQQYWAAQQQQQAAQQQAQQQGFRIVVSNGRQEEDLEEEEDATGSEEESGSEESGSDSESGDDSADESEEMTTDEDYDNNQLSPMASPDDVGGDFGHNRMRTDMTTFGDSDESDEEEQ